MDQGDDDDRGPLMFYVTVALLAVSTVTVIMRCFVRIYIIRTFWSEDWLALATMTCFGLYCACVFVTVENGAGKHLTDIPPENLPEALKARWFGEIAYILTSVLLKFTVGIFLLRICSQRWQIAVIWTVLVVVLLFNIFYFFVALVQCLPISYFWMRVSLSPVPKGKCVSHGLADGSTYAATAVNAFADWTLGLLPIVLVWNLGLGRKTKISVAAVLSLGIVASTATLVRIPYVWQLTHNIDFLYVFSDFLIWSTVENGLGLIASSAATLRPLYLRYVKGHKGGLPDADGPRPTSATIYQQRYRHSPAVSPHAPEFQCRGLPEEDEDEKQRQLLYKDHLWDEKTAWESAEGSGRGDADVEKGEAEPRREARRHRLSLPPPARSAGIRYWDGMATDKPRAPIQAHAHMHIPRHPNKTRQQGSTAEGAAEERDDEDDDEDDKGTAELTATELRSAPAAHYHRSSGWTWNTVEPGLVAGEDSYHYWVVAGADPRRTSSRAHLVGGGGAAGGRRTW